MCCEGLTGTGLVSWYSQYHTSSLAREACAGGKKTAHVTGTSICVSAQMMGDGVLKLSCVMPEEVPKSLSCCGEEREGASCPLTAV